MTRNNFLLKTVLSVTLLLVTLLFVSEGGYAISPLDKVDDTGNPVCKYSQDLIGKYDIKVGGVGLIDEREGNDYSGSFVINNVPGTPYKAYLYWTMHKKTIDSTIKLKINSGGMTNLDASSSNGQVFGPAKLNTNNSYSGYIVDLAPYISSGLIRSGNNSFTVEKTVDAAATEIFGAGVMIIYSDPSMAQQRHIEVKCGFDGTFMDDLGDDNNAKWGEWSDVVCHDFPADPDDIRNVKYYAFMSGTKKRDELAVPKIYRPNAFWYKTGTGSHTFIEALNKAPGIPNGGLDELSGIAYNDLFDANSNNEWDTISFSSINIPREHNYICLQTQSRNIEPVQGQYRKGTSMQWSMSALSFAYAGGSSSPTPTPLISHTPSPTPIAPSWTPTPSPTPIVYHPWVNTIGGNAYSGKFNQMSLNKVNQSNSNRIQNTFISSSHSINNISAYLSTYLNLQKSGGALPSRSSKSNFDLANYQDGNKEYRPGFAWFVYLEQFLTNTTADVVKLTNPNISVNSVSDIPGTNANKVNIIMLGDTNFSIKTCDRKAIFVVDGNLQIDPDLVVSGFENGCLFIVRGTTIVRAGDNLGSSDITPLTNYDQLHAYFITGLFETSTDSSLDGLYIWGGVVETADSPTGQIELNRTLSSSRNEFSPSETIEYDPRYLYIYGDLLTYSFGYNIRESQYIRSL